MIERVLNGYLLRCKIFDRLLKTRNRDCAQSRCNHDHSPATHFKLGV